MRLLSGFGILHYKLKLETKPASAIISPTTTSTADQYIRHSKNNNNTTRTSKSTNSNKTLIARHNSDASSDLKHKSSYNNNKSIKTRDGRNRTRASKDENRSRPKRPQSWHSSNSSIDNNLNEQRSDKNTTDSKYQDSKYPASSSSSSKKEKKSISDGHDYKSRRSQVVKQNRAKDFEKKAKDLAEKTGTTMSWSEFLADSRNSPVSVDKIKPDNQKPQSAGHFTVTQKISNPEYNKFSSENNGNNQDGTRQQPKRVITRKLSILDRLRQKVSLEENRNYENFLFFFCYLSRYEFAYFFATCAR